MSEIPDVYTLSAEQKRAIVTANFDRIAPLHYERTNPVELYGKYLDEFNLDVTRRGGERILLVGGSVQEAQLFNRAYCVTALDCSENILAQIRNHVPTLTTRAASLTATGLPDASFDAIWAANVMQHIPPEELILAVQEMRRVLKVRGSVGLVFNPNPDGKGSILEKITPEEHAKPENGGQLYQALYPYPHVSKILEDHQLMNYYTELWDYKNEKYTERQAYLRAVKWS